jgi:hypothetical protein
MLFLARGIEDDHCWVVQEIDGALVETRGGSSTRRTATGSAMPTTLA